MLMALALLFFTASAHASLITWQILDTKVQAALVGTGSFGGYSDGSWHTTIGASATFGFIHPHLTMDVDDQNGSFTINIFTNFAAGDNNTYNTVLGDMFFITTAGTFAIDMVTGELFSDENPQLSTAVFPNQASAAGITSYAYGKMFGYGELVNGQIPSERTMNPYVKINNDTATSLAFTSSIVKNPQEANTSPYTYTISGAFNLLTVLGLSSGSTFDVVLAPTCANSVLWARGTLNGDPPGGGPNPIPEPGTIALLGLGMIGLFIGRKRFFRK